jgi:hypothetical protein
MKNKTFLLIPLALLVVISAAFFVIWGSNKQSKQTNNNSEVAATPTPTIDIFASPTPQPTINPDIVATRNMERKADVGSIANALSQYKVQKKSYADLGQIPECPSSIRIGTSIGALDLSKKLVPEFMVSIPVDPQGSELDTGYGLCINAAGKIEVESVRSEDASSIKAIAN